MLNTKLKHAIDERHSDLSKSFTLDWSQELSFLDDLMAEAQPAKMGLIDVPLHRCHQASIVNAFMTLMQFNLSLDPAAKLATMKVAVDHQHGYAIAVPEVLAMGYLVIASKAGLVKNAKGSLIFEGDEFQFNGFYEYPDFKANPNSNKANIQGGFVCAIMADGDVLTSVISPEELHAAIDESLFKKYGGVKCWSQADIRDALEASIMRRFLKQAMTYTFANDESETLLFELLEVHTSYFRSYNEVSQKQSTGYNPRHKACVSEQSSTLLRALGHSTRLPKLAPPEPQEAPEEAPELHTHNGLGLTDLFGLQIGLGG
ncbi:recombinase RecT [Motilimonas eburnea]|uniref:recombinase RecT n=1 Tax=Motilimonas eburnea TaxID=1737488 RepID=UPI001E541E13|nr:recombinase RecT [Motilimonas eburnea]MCE2571672.1 recombinase RecT [Motilimonas eburnea]